MNTLHESKRAFTDQLLWGLVLAAANRQIDKGLKILFWIWNVFTEQLLKQENKVYQMLMEMFAFSVKSYLG